MLNESEFWIGIKVLLKNHHSIQKQLCGIKILHVQQISPIEIENLIRMDKNNFCDWIDSLKFNDSGIQEYNIDNTSKRNNRDIIITKFIFKNSPSSSLGFQILNFEDKSYYCRSFFHQFNDFAIFYKNESIIITILKPENKKGIDWTEYFLKPKFLKWCKNELDSKKEIIKSLTLIDIEDYVKLHKELKEKYAQDIINIWTESTDPLKFVHEDISIAAYLICLWKSTNTEPKINFVDLGCGNGLLVYILNNYGYPGYGIDIRRRKIWDLYPNNIKLIEETINPNVQNSNLNADWLIGNHSDELSPWIPVIAARNSIDTKFFLLPCCAFEFSGEKYQRRCTNESIYQDFLKYAEKITEKCGYIILKDRLKIPSTKRIAIIGIGKQLSCNIEDQSLELTKFIEHEMHSPNIKFRKKEELVKNCTTIDQNIRSNIILKIFNYLITPLPTKSLENEEWVKGRTVNFKEIVRHLNPDDFKQIKDQCGGLKTLLKNYHEIFVIKNNDIQIRKPEYHIENVTKKNYKKRNCFFFLYHPNSCPLDELECSFVHPK